MPAAAKEHSKAGAEAFVRYFWEVVNYAQATGDTEILAALFSSGCAGCLGGVAAIESTYIGGGHVEGGRADIRDLRVEVGSAGQTFVVADVTVKVRTAPSRVIYPDAAKNRTFPGGTTTYHMNTSASSDEWSVSKLEAAT